MTYYQKITQNNVLRRIIVLLAVILCLFILRSLLSVFLLTFIFTYLINRLVKRLNLVMNFSSTVITGGIYLLVVVGIIWALNKSIPLISHQSLQLYNSLENFYTQQSKGSEETKQVLFQYVSKLLPYIKSQSHLLISSLKNVMTMAVTLGMSFILSFFFMIEKEKVATFSSTFLSGKSAWFFSDIAYFGKKFITTFGVVIEAQVIIAVINTCITSIALYFLKFPHLLSLTMMVFLFSFIPVAGVVLSCVPLSLIAYYNGGLMDVVSILIVILAVHMLESYVLNPKLMSKRTKLPIFYTFFILLISEHFFQVWGLVFGIPLFMFILDLIGVKKIEAER